MKQERCTLKKLKENRGITLIALIVTVIVLIILAGITIRTLSADNGVLKHATKSKISAEISNEREIVHVSTVQAIGRNKFGKLVYSEYKAILDENSNNGITLEEDEKDFYITFIESQRMYFVNGDGTISYLGSYEDLINSATLTVTPENNTSPKLVQTADVTVSTMIAKEDDEVFIHYGWSTDENTEPQYESANNYTTSENKKKRTIEIPSTANNAGNYYLWVKADVGGEILAKKVGPFAIKSHTTLVATNTETSPTKGFLGSASTQNANIITRSNINSVTILDSFTDSKGVTHSLNDSNCWDVSANKSGDIIAWYDEAKDSSNNTITDTKGNTMYDISIAQLGGVTANSNSTRLFYNVGQNGSAENVINGIENLDTQLTTNMSDMFRSCTAKSMNLGSFNTSNVIYMGTMFYDCAVKTLDLRNFNTSKVTTMGYMFNNCKVEQLDISSFDTSKVGNMVNMFAGCKGLSSIDVSGFNTSNVKDMNYMFIGCSSLTSLNVTNFDTSKVTNMWCMFSGCKGLTTLDVSNFDTGNVVNMTDMFSGCQALKSLNLSNLNTNKVENMGQMFKGCSSLTSLDLSDLDTGNVTNMNQMFYNCNKLNTLNISSFDTGNVKTMQQMFEGCNGIIDLDLSNFNTSSATTLYRMFVRCVNMKSVNVSSFNTENVTNMQDLFYECHNLESVDVSNFNTSKVTNMGSMFSGCNKLTNINLSNFNTSNVETMSNMFLNCNILESVNLSSFDTSKVKNMNNLFNGCKVLKTIDISSFNTQSATTMISMFSGCQELTTIYVGNGWNVTNVETSTNMFNKCAKLVGDISFNSSYIDKTYATKTGGYLTYKAP